MATSRYIFALTALLLVVASSGFAQVAPGAAGAPSPYRVLVTGVDSSEFPRVKLRFKVIIQQAGIQPWEPTSGVKLVERVDLVKYDKNKNATAEASTKDARKPSDVDLCEIKPVALGVAVDVSGSVSGPLGQEIANGVSKVFMKMREESQKLKVEDVGALYAFSTKEQARFPLPQGLQAPSLTGQGSGGSFVQYPGATGGTSAGSAAGTSLYTANEGLEQLAQIAQQIPQGGGSPIWNGMKNEAELLSKHDPQNTDLQRVLVTLTDGQDNESNQADVDRLMYLAQQAGISLVNLGYGKTNKFGLGSLANMTGGVFVDGVNENIDQVLIAILDGMRKTYCIEYDSPHPNYVNEAALVTVALSDGSAGTGVFPLPFVIPEDSQNVKLFVPVTEAMFKTLVKNPAAKSAGGQNAPVYLTAKAQLVDENGDNWTPRKAADGQDGPSRKVTELEFFTTEWREGVTGKPLSGWGIYLSSVKDEWNQIFQTPTDYVELHDDDTRQVVDGVSHWVISANIEQPTQAQVAGAKTSTAKKDHPVKIRLSVQDRTPPSVLVRARPQDGGSILEAKVMPQSTDQDTEILLLDNPGFTPVWGQAASSFSQPTYLMAKTPGQKSKRARLEYRWRDGADAAVEGAIDGQRWTLYDQDQKPTFRGTDSAGGVDSAISGTEHGITEQGILLIASTRMRLRVAARDNYALLQKSGLPSDKDAFTNPVDADGKPVHASFELSRPEAEAFAEEAPYFPFMKRDEMDREENRSKPGMTWWIESKDPRDRYHELEGVTEVHYNLDDSTLRPELEAAGELKPGETLRVLKVLAQDGQGNHTTLEFPMQVVPSNFRARTIEWQTERRQGSVLD